MLAAHLTTIQQGQDLTMEQMAEVVDAMMSGDLDEAMVEAFLLGLREKGESVEEVAGAAAAMRRHMTPIRTSRTPLVDTCGTGGSGSGIFNVSTAAAIVTAACGVPVAKHGNRKISSKSGSADVLTELGVDITASVATVERCLEEVGIAFCFAQCLHPSMKHVGPVRQRLAVPTIFNLLGPLCNPAGASYQVLGVGRPEIRSLIAEALQRLGTRRAVILHGRDGLCEISNAEVTDVSLVEDGQIQPREWSPESFGLSRSAAEPLRVEGPPASARLIHAIFEGQAGPPRDIVVLNAAAALWLVGHAETLPQAATLAAAAIDSGRAAQTLARLAEVSRG